MLLNSYFAHIKNTLKHEFLDEKKFSKKRSPQGWKTVMTRLCHLQ